MPDNIQQPETAAQLEPLVGRLLSAVKSHGLWAGPKGAEPGSAADMCREAAEWIVKMRAASVLVETQEGPRVMLPYSFMVD
jgi:hypothetical protein